jgi:hypothetical protein
VRIGEAWYDEMVSTFQEVNLYHGIDLVSSNVKTVFSSKSMLAYTCE